MTKNQSNESLSSFSGFLDGYRAGNIERLETAIDAFRWDITGQTELLEKEVASFQDNEVIQALGLVRKHMQDTQSDAVKKALVVGDALLQFIIDIKGKKLLKKLTPASIAQLRTTVLRFLETAQRSGETAIISLAVRLGKELE
jgi:hypothetical protein